MTIVLMPYEDAKELAVKHSRALLDAFGVAEHSTAPVWRIAVVLGASVRLLAPLVWESSRDPDTRESSVALSLFGRKLPTDTEVEQRMREAIEALDVHAGVCGGVLATMAATLLDVFRQRPSLLNAQVAERLPVLLHDLQCAAGDCIASASSDIGTRAPSMPRKGAPN